MNNLISVVVPIHKIQKDFSNVRQQLHLATQIEIIYVIDEKLSEDIIPSKTSNEQIIRVPNLGRGYMFREGVQYVKGDIIMFLHSDTVLPKDWDTIVRCTMQDKKVIGGGFSLKFDIDNLYLTLSLKIITMLVRLRKIFSGDRAIFLRSQPFKNDMPNLEVPIMEDIKLSYWMKKHGKVILLKDSVVTSSDAFVKNGLIRQTWKIIKCMVWHKVGGNLQEIYSYYYS
jgi:cellulose synthase/poly-beta-1,6-N-acetylglucosamine synthase-like glycosyltransferase